MAIPSSEACVDDALSTMLNLSTFLSNRAAEGAQSVLRTTGSDAKSTTASSDKTGARTVPTEIVSGVTGIQKVGVDSTSVFPSVTNRSSCNNETGSVASQHAGRMQFDRDSSMKSPGIDASRDLRMSAAAAAAAAAAANLKLSDMLLDQSASMSSCSSIHRMDGFVSPATVTSLLDQARPGSAIGDLGHSIPQQPLMSSFPAFYEPLKIPNKDGSHGVEASDASVSMHVLASRLDSGAQPSPAAPTVHGHSSSAQTFWNASDSSQSGLPGIGTCLAASQTGVTSPQRWFDTQSHSHAHVQSHRQANPAFTWLPPVEGDSAFAIPSASTSASTFNAVTICRPKPVRALPRPYALRADAFVTQSYPFGGLRGISTRMHPALNANAPGLSNQYPTSTMERLAQERHCAFRSTGAESSPLASSAPECHDSMLGKFWSQLRTHEEKVQSESTFAAGTTAVTSSPDAQTRSMCSATVASEVLVRPSAVRSSPDGVGNNPHGNGSLDDSSSSTANSVASSSSMPPTSASLSTFVTTQRPRTRSMTRAKAIGTGFSGSHTIRPTQRLSRSASVDSSQTVAASALLTMAPFMDPVPASASESKDTLVFSQSLDHQSEADSNDQALAAGEAPLRNIDLFERAAALPGERVFRYATGVRRVPPSGARKIAKKSLSKRMQVRAKLQFVQFYQDRHSHSAPTPDPPRTLSDTRPPKSSDAYFRIRVWKDKYGTKFYDCACGGRKPVQDLSKIKRHAIGHDKRNYTCNVCGKSFLSNHLQLNAHKKIHKDESRRRQKQQLQQHQRALAPACASPPVVHCLPAVSSSPLSHELYSKPDAFDDLDANLISSLGQASHQACVQMDTSVTEISVAEKVESSQIVVKSE